MNNKKIYIAKPEDIQSLSVKKGWFSSKLVITFFGGAKATVSDTKENVLEHFLQLRQALESMHQSQMQQAQQMQAQQMQMQQMQQTQEVIPQDKPESLT